MGKFFIFLLFLVFLIGNILAIGFSPTSLIYELKANQKECQMITLISNSEKVDVYDKWAENKEAEWSVSSFNKESSTHGLSLTYPKELSSNERQVEVCVSGSKEGEYHGVLLLKEEQKGNSIMQAGVWLKVLIGQEKTQAKQPTTATSTNTNTENSAKVLLRVQKQESEKTTTETTKEADKTTASGITGSAVGSNNSGAGKSILTIIIILIVIGAFIALFNYRKLQKRRMEYGY